MKNSETSILTSQWMYANTEIYAIESLFLGKKTYIYISEPTDKDGKTVNSEHIRMKGIPTPCIEY